MKRNELQLYTPIEVYDALMRQIDSARGKSVKLERDALAKILIDHGRLCAKLEDLGGEVAPGAPDE